MIPAGKSFLRLPDGAGPDGKFKGIRFSTLQAGQNAVQLFVEVFFHKGSKYTNAWAVASDGKRTLLTPTPVKEDDYEYDLYKRATALYSTCASDGYELLRFGRILSTPVTLATPAARATWMRVTFAAGQEGYIDMSDESIVKLSDADFSTFMGWQKIVEGNTPFSADGLCDIDALKKLLKDVNDHQTPEEAALRQENKEEDVLAQYVKSNDSVREQLRGFICEAPSEWDSSQNEARYSKLKNEGEFYHGDEAGYAAFTKRLKSFQFWDKTGLAPGQQLWYFHPLAFIRHFRKCGWLSHSELAGTFPRYLYYSNGGSPISAITMNNSTYMLTKGLAKARIRNYVVPLNQTIQKYFGSDARRIAIFLAQILLETAQWRDLGGTRRLMHEWGFGKFSAANPATKFYGPFYGRGTMQLTWAGNFAEYGKFRALAEHSDTYVERMPNTDARITETSEHYTFNPRNGGTLMRWSPRFDPDRVAEEPSLACDSGGFYWVSKPYSLGININRVADKQYSADNVGLINRLVNGGFNGYNERQAYTVFIMNELWDAMPDYFPELISPARRATIRPDLSRCGD
ncbi:hypothetical protein AWB72_05653 [Caballeronia concitans]|uniref:Uncharacterized protein n=2 Tax=Caballeronia concitans TaxID=1777133 RepID=A0A658R5Q5_9BURK|nr:hypothetical protein AWB72_05653 [Caballeronia concitans]